MRAVEVAFDAETDAKSWNADGGGAIGDGIVSYALQRRQQVAIAAGMTSPIWPTGKVTARLVVYGL